LTFAKEIMRSWKDSTGGGRAGDGGDREATGRERREAGNARDGRDVDRDGQRGQGPDRDPPQRRVGPSQRFAEGVVTRAGRVDHRLACWWAIGNGFDPDEVRYRDLDSE
jgi:hypothetical protein